MDRVDFRLTQLAGTGQKLDPGSLVQGWCSGPHGPCWLPSASKPLEWGVGGIKDQMLSKSQTQMKLFQFKWPQVQK